jgi:phosphate-selective porin OprO/OprP
MPAVDEWSDRENPDGHHGERGFARFSPLAGLVPAVKRGTVMMTRVRLALGIIVLTMSGCATPQLVQWEPPVPWKTNQALSPPPATLPQPIPSTPVSQFATDMVRSAGATEAAPPLPSGPPPSVIGPATEAPNPDARAVDIKLDEAKASKDPTFKLRGRVEADAITVNQSEKDKALFGDFQNAVGFRRLRLGSEGTAGEMTRWVAEVDFAGGDVSIKDAFVAVNNLPFLREVRVGHIAEPFSLEGQIRSIWFPFTERSPAFTLDPARNWGVGVFSYTEDQRLFVQAGAFRSGTDNTGTDVGDGNDWAYTARVVGLPWYEECGDSLRLWHVGGAASQRYAKDNTVSFNQGPQSSLLQSGTDNPRTPFVPTVSIPANQYQLYNLQSAVVLGPLSFQAEWNVARVEQTGGGPVVLQGGYVLAGYFLTGEHRTYNREVGTFWEPTVRRPFVCTDGAAAVAQGAGAWELTARLAYLDVDSPNLAPGPNGLPIGTRTTTVTVGLNWYLNDNARIMLDWVHAVPVNAVFGSSTADVVTVRTAVFW